MNKKIIALFLAGAMIAALCGCGNTADNGNETATETTTETTALVMDTEAEVILEAPEVSSTDFDINYADYVTLPDYSAIPVTVSADYEITDASENAYLYNILSYYGCESTSGEVTDRDTVQMGDVVSCDYTGYLDGTAFDGGAATDQMVLVAETGTGYIPGFSTGLIGAKVGDTITCDVTFPDEYSSNTDLEGKTTQFEFVIHAIYQPYTFDTMTDDDVANGIGATVGISTVEELKGAIEYNMSSNLYDAKSTEIQTYLGDNSTVEIPEDYMEARMAEYVYGFQKEYCEDGDLDAYLQENYGIGYDEAYSEWEENMTSTITDEFIFLYIAQLEGIELDEENFQSYIEYLVSNSDGEIEDEASAYDYYGYGNSALGEKTLKDRYLMNMALNQLVENAVVTYE